MARSSTARAATIGLASLLCLVGCEKRSSGPRDGSVNAGAEVAADHRPGNPDLPVSDGPTDGMIEIDSRGFPTADDVGDRSDGPRGGAETGDAGGRLDSLATDDAQIDVPLGLGDSGIEGATAPDGATGSGGYLGSGGHTGSGGDPGSGGHPGSGGTSSLGGTTGTGGSSELGTGPCDIFAAATPPTPCAAAYSMARVLLSSYRGPLYQVRRGGVSTDSGAATLDIGAVAGGFGDAAAQDEFCTSSCTVSKLYDQSGNGNDLVVAPKPCFDTDPQYAVNYEATANKRRLTVGGHTVFALYTNVREGYRSTQTTGMPTGSTAQGIYVLADGKHVGPGCCWDFGNVPANGCTFTATTNALYFGFNVANVVGSGPWFMADTVDGLVPSIPPNIVCADGCFLDIPSMGFDFAFGALTTDSNQALLKTGSARSGGLLPGYGGQIRSAGAMQGGIVLGVDLTNENRSSGTFYEGAITLGAPAQKTIEAVFQNLQAAGYGQ